MDGSKHRTRNDAAEGAWTPRPLLAFLVRAAAVLIPVGLGTLAARWTSARFAPSASVWLVGAASLAAAVVVSLGTARLVMRALPLAALLKMTMIFPDHAPSRLKVARRASKAELTRRLQDPDTDSREAAATLLALATALSRHDRITRGHSERVRLLCDLLGQQLGLSEFDRGRLRWAGLLHDIGKLEVAAAILNKPGALDDRERRIMQDHPEHGARIARPLAAWLGPWYDGIGQHHEKFDGTGYPRGLAGEQISVAARAVAVVDAFDTMTSARSYKSPVPTVAARAELTRCAGSHFDPAMVRAFLAIALPRLLWTMGPLTFLVNVPFLRWIPAASVRTADAASAGLAGASGAVQAGAVAAAVVSAPVSAVVHASADAPAPSSTHTTQLTGATSYEQAVTGGTRTPGTGTAAPATRTGAPAGSTGSTVAVRPNAVPAGRAGSTGTPSAAGVPVPASVPGASSSRTPGASAGAVPGQARKSIGAPPPGQTRGGGPATQPGKGSTSPGKGQGSNSPATPPANGSTSPGKGKGSNSPATPPAQADQGHVRTTPPGPGTKG